MEGSKQERRPRRSFTKGFEAEVVELVRQIRGARLAGLLLAGLLLMTACFGDDGAGRPGAPRATVDVRTVDWANSSVPGSVCGGEGAVQLKDSEGLVSSSRWPDAWRGSRPAVMPNQVQVWVDNEPVRFGSVMDDGRMEAVVPVWCTNGGGTADGQLGQSLVVFHGTPDGPSGGKNSSVRTVSRALPSGCERSG